MSSLDDIENNGAGFATPESLPMQKPLACAACRRRKVKCRVDARNPLQRCELCHKSGNECIFPTIDERRFASSRRVNRELHEKVAALEAELAEYRNAEKTANEDLFTTDVDAASETVSSALPETNSSGSNSMIIRLCGGQRQLNSDRVGRLRFFGPTSSLHLSESVVSTVLNCEPRGRGRYQWQDVLSNALQDQLLELYWKFQHHNVPIVHREAFLQDLDRGVGRYCSKLLVYCLLTRAAAISEQPEIRALALAEDEINEDPPLLVSQCAALLDSELNHPGITTLQSLQLLSEIYCVLSNETKGWLDAGGACRLAFELGLHSDDIALGGMPHLSAVDHEVRQIAFWSCFSFDRIWALYLGRPQMIKLDDVTATKQRSAAVSYEMKIAHAWADLLEIVGFICDALNGVKTTKHRVAILDRKLRDWRLNLDPIFAPNAQQSPAAILLHMQYAAAAILLHRPLARFGCADTFGSPTLQRTARDTCVYNACAIAYSIRTYQTIYGNVLSMSWMALHMISTASTTLIANIAESSGHSDNQQSLGCIRTCIRALGELEKSHLPTRRVRRVIQHALRLLDLEFEVANASIAADTESEVLTTGYGSGLDSTTAGNSSTWDDPLPALMDEYLPSGYQIDLMESFPHSLLS